MHRLSLYLCTVCRNCPSGLNPALVGLSLTYIISLAGMLQYVVRQSAEVESIVSVLVVYNQGWAKKFQMVDLVVLIISPTTPFGGMFISTKLY